MSVCVRTYRIVQGVPVFHRLLRLQLLLAASLTLRLDVALQQFIHLGLQIAAVGAGLLNQRNIER